MNGRVSWQVVAWVLAILLTSVSTYQATSAQFQASILTNERATSVNRERLSVLESQYGDIQRRLATIESLLRDQTRP